MMERRTAPRVKPPASLKARVRAYMHARVIDISARGILLEVPHSLLPKTSCDIRIQNGDEEIVLAASVKRCAVAGSGTDERGQKALVYKAALEYTEPFSQTAAKIGAVLPELKKHAAEGSVTLGVDKDDA